jgi:hypothetical protein
MSFDLEKELKQALRREDAAHDFSERVMASVAAASGAKRKPAQAENRWWWRLLEFFRPAQVKWALAGAALFFIALAAFGVHHYREQQRAAAEIAEGERAKEQVMLALKIASAKLNIAQKKIVDGSR